MDPSILPQVAVEHLYPFMVLGAFFAVGIGGLALLVLKARDRSDHRTAAAIKAGLESIEHRRVIREESVEALRTPAGREELERAARAAAVEAFQGLAKPIEIAQTDHLRRIERLEGEVTTVREKHGERLGQLETWKSGAAAAIENQAGHGRRIGALEKWVVLFGKILKHAKLMDGEETT